jgi:hypothetical protein
MLRWPSVVNGLAALAYLVATVLGGVMTLVAVITVGWRFSRPRRLKEIASLGVAALERDPAASA